MVTTYLFIKVTALNNSPCEYIEHSYTMWVEGFGAVSVLHALLACVTVKALALKKTHLSLFFVMSEGSTPSMRFLKHCAMSSCFSKGCMAITFRCNSWKYWKKNRKQAATVRQVNKDRFNQIFVHYRGNTPANGFLYSPNLSVWLYTIIVRRSYIRITLGNEKV